LKPITFTVFAVLAALGIATGGATLAADAAEIVSFEVVDGESIPQSLTGSPGDAAKGRETAINRKKGNCLACHVMPIPEQPFHGLLGPDLTGVADRFTEGELRLRVVDPKVVNEDTIMPAFYKNAGLHRVLKKFKDKSILSAEDVEDIVAYLLTLK
jgi:sulfur-oxidizing protein SoxX